MIVFIIMLIRKDICTQIVNWYYMGILQVA